MKPTPIYLYHQNSLETPHGYVLLEGRLPSHLRIEGTIYERYGRVNAYRYISIPDAYILDIPKEDITLY
jgi:hypothetical protein